MKRLAAILLCLIMALALAGCGGQETAAGNEITALLDEGYTTCCTSCGDTSWAGIFQKGNSWDSVYRVTAAMTEAQSEAFMNIGYEDDYEAEERQILGQLSDVTVTDITDKVPAQEELDAWVGRTMGDLEADGFARNGYMGDPETGYEFIFDGPVYSLDVTAAEAVDDLDNYSENDLRGLAIGSVRFAGFSFQLLEES